MATSKTLSPTGVSISIPAMSDKPDQRVNSDCIDKETDAINTLNTMIGNSANLKRPATAIPNNSDFDDYTTPGSYYVNNASAAATMSNIPFSSSGGRLDVIGQNADTVYQRQIYYPTGTVKIYTRLRGSSNGTVWGNWYEIQMSAV